MKERKVIYYMCEHCDFETTDKQEMQDHELVLHSCKHEFEDYSLWFADYDLFIEKVCKLCDCPARAQYSLYDLESLSSEFIKTLSEELNK